jgi:hypothetical protein
MNLVSELDLPPFDYTAFFLRSRATTFPGRQIAEFFGVTGGPLAPPHDLALDGPPHLGGVEGSYGIDKLPIIWSVSSKVNPNHGPVPYVS